MKEPVLEGLGGEGDMVRPEPIEGMASVPSHRQAQSPLAPIGRARGGYARAAALSPERRSEICRDAANVRWARGWLAKTPPGSAQ